MKSALAVVAAVFALAGCQPDQAQLASASNASTSAPGRDGSSKSYTFEKHVYPEQTRLVAFGDVHGDLEAAKRALRLAGATDASDKWIGKDLFVVQVGDQLDRGDDDRAIIDYFMALRDEAKAAGGVFLPLNGNHELMNVELDFRYATEGANRAFADVPFPPELANHDASTRGRAAAFTPGGPYAVKLASQPLYAVVGSSVLAHGGVLMKHLQYGLDKMDDEVRDWLLGKREKGPAIVLAEDGVVWTRAFSAQTGASDCAALSEVLNAMGAKRMIMGHTPQKPGISIACDGKAIRIDTGLARYYQGPIEVIEIVGDQPRVLKE